MAPDLGLRTFTGRTHNEEKKRMSQEMSRGAMCGHDTCELRYEKLTADFALEALEEVFEAMSSESRYMRYLAATPRLTSSLIRVLTDLDETRHVAWQATACDRAVGLVRLVEDTDGTPELAVEVADDLTGCGIGGALVSVALRHAAERGAAEVRILVHPENTPALRLFRAAGASFVFRDGALEGLIPVTSSASAAA
jgi:RimJ/RimL family protein N-acetyltransferase